MRRGLHSKGQLQSKVRSFVETRGTTNVRILARNFDITERSINRVLARLIEQGTVIRLPVGRAHLIVWIG